MWLRRVLCDQELAFVLSCQTVRMLTTWRLLHMYLQEPIHACYATSDACIGRISSTLLSRRLLPEAKRGILYYTLLFLLSEMLLGRKAHPDPVQIGSRIVLRLKRRRIDAMCRRLWPSLSAEL